MPADLAKYYEEILSHMENDSNFGNKAVCLLCGNEFDLCFVKSGSYPLCSRCWSRDRLRECDRWLSLKRRCEARELPVTLSLREWIQIVSYFRNCALCRQAHYSHMLLLTPEQGMVMGNVFPCCHACKALLDMGFESALARLAATLAQPLELSEKQIENLKYQEDLL